MRNIIILISLILFSCTEPKYQFIEQEIIDGKVSAIQTGTAGRFAARPIIWVQDARKTEQVTIPYEYEGKWKVGDSCLLIIEKYKEIEP